LKTTNINIVAQDPHTAGLTGRSGGVAQIIAEGIFEDKPLTVDELNQLVNSVGETLASIWQKRVEDEIAERKRNKNSDTLPGSGWTPSGGNGVGQC
jgi:hypothetical protein